MGGGGSSGWMLGLAVPGLTVPWSHAVYLWLATAVSIGVHEVGLNPWGLYACGGHHSDCGVSQLCTPWLQAGHALAAAAEGVGLRHVAAFTVLLLPGAYVELDTETLAVLSPWRTLRVSFRLEPLVGADNLLQCFDFRV